MRLGFMTALFPELSLEEVMDFAAREGFASIEVMCWPPGRAERKFAGVSHIDVTTLDNGGADKVTELCERTGVAISALGFYPNLLDPDRETADAAAAHLHQVIEAAPKLGLTRVNSFVGRDWKLTVDENWPRFLEVWRPLVKHAEEHGVFIGIENCPMLFTADEWPGGKNLFTSPAIWRRAFEELDSDHFGLNYDPSHFILLDIDPIAPLEEFASKLFHVHAKDLAIDEAALAEHGRFDFPKQWHLPRIPGFGEIDWGAFFAELIRVGYRGDVAIEVEDETFGPTLEDRQRALRTAGNVLRPFVG